MVEEKKEDEEDQQRKDEGRRRTIPTAEEHPHILPMSATALETNTKRGRRALGTGRPYPPAPPEQDPRRARSPGCECSKGLGSGLR
jgi:hypothetical protein